MSGANHPTPETKGRRWWCAHGRLRAEGCRQCALLAKERFGPHPCKRISSWLSIRHGRGRLCGHGQNVVMTYRRDTFVVLDMNEAKRLRNWLDSVIP